MIEKAGASQDDAERMELFGKAEKLLLDEGGWCLCTMITARSMSRATSPA